MTRALYTAATGMYAQQLKIDVIANNLANVNTDGYKTSRAEFQDLIYQTMRTAGSGTSRDTSNPIGLQIGLGVRPDATSRSFEQGQLKETHNPLNLAINGDGLLQVRLPTGEMAFTRNGALKIDESGQLVTSEGYQLEPPIVLPADTNPERLTIAPDGTVTARSTDDTTREIELGRITIARMLNQGALEGLGGNLYRLSGSSKGMQIGTPGEDGLGTLQQGYLESSNVKVVEEMIAMITGQRAYESNSKVIQTADRMLEETNRLR